jgi:DNA replication licensing factor MCM4
MEEDDEGLGDFFSQPGAGTQPEGEDEMPGGAPGSPRSQSQRAPPQQSQSQREEAFIWGTTVSTETCKQRFRAFVNGFTHRGVRYYLALLEQMKLTGNYNYALDCEHLARFDMDLYRDLVRYPQEVIPVLDVTLDEMFREMLADEADDHDLEEQVKVRPFRLLAKRSMRDLNPADVGSLVAIQGMVTRCSQCVPDLRRAFYVCSQCMKTVSVDIDRGFIHEPAQCPGCMTRGTLAIEYNRCLFADRQVVKLQETPDAIPEGETPQTVTLNVYQELLDAAKPGDRVIVTGIFRASSVRQNSTQRAVRSVFRTYVDAMHFEKEVKRSSDDDETAVDANAWPPQKVALFREIGRAPDVYDRLVRSVAPSVWELDDCKKGILCQLFGGVPKVLKDAKARGDINILLCGDPGTSKSQLLQYVHKLAPRGVYTSGKGSSAVGLTAYVTRDTDTGQAVLESGALVLSDRGIW